MTPASRDAGGWGGLGLNRHERFKAAFDRVVHCVDKEYYLEAIAILDSLIYDRMASRLNFLKKREVNCPQPADHFARP